MKNRKPEVGMEVAIVGGKVVLSLAVHLETC
jgi:hypothetical protein